MGTPVTMTGDLGTLLERVAALIAGSSTFQTWCGVANAAAALAHVVFYSEELGDVGKPYALIYLGDNVRRGGGGPGGFASWFDGTVVVEFIADLPAEYLDDGQNGMKWFIDKVSNVEQDMATLSGSEAYLEYRRPGPAYQIVVDEQVGDDGSRNVELTWPWFLQLESGV